MSFPVTLRDFCPFNHWKPSETKDSLGNPLFLIDKTTGRHYSYESPFTLRIKFALLLPTSPLVHYVGVIGNIVYRIFKILLFLPLISKIVAKKPWTFRELCIETGKDLLRVLFAIPIYVGLEGALVLGLLMPYNGRKLYATLERAFYGDFLIGKTFQPIIVSALKA
jgi:hypothetical protein